MSPNLFVVRTSPFDGSNNPIHFANGIVVAIGNFNELEHPGVFQDSAALRIFLHREKLFTERAANIARNRAVDEPGRSRTLAKRFRNLCLAGSESKHGPSDGQSNA